MVSISDLGTPDSRNDIPDTPENRAIALAAFTVKLDDQNAAYRTATLASNSLSSYELPNDEMVKIVKPHPAIAIMREQATYARRQSLDAQRPWWMKSGSWSLIVSIISLIVAIVALSDFKYSDKAFWTYFSNLMGGS